MRKESFKAFEIKNSNETLQSNIKEVAQYLDSPKQDTELVYSFNDATRFGVKYEESKKAKKYRTNFPRKS